MVTNILIIKTGAMGDVLRTSVILQGLKKKYQKCKIYWVTSKGALPLLEKNPLIERIFTNDPRVHIDLEDTKFELIINLEENPEIFKKYREILTYDKWVGPYNYRKDILYTDDFSPIYDMSLISKYNKQKADALKFLNQKSYPELLYECLGLKWNEQKYSLYGYSKNKKQLKGDKPLIGLVIGTGPRWPMKSLTDDRHIKLIRLIQEEFKSKIGIMIIPGEDDYDRALSIQTYSNKYHNVLVAKPSDMNSLIKNINACDVIITPDTLPMHIAIALEKYVIAYFTITSASEIKIYNGNKIIPYPTEERDIENGYCSYTTKLLPRPNITDVIDLYEILNEVNFCLKRKNI